jgi:hypothetical protein
MSVENPNPFDLLLEQIRSVVREEIAIALNGNGHVSNVTETAEEEKRRLERSKIVCAAKAAAEAGANARLVHRTNYPKQDKSAENGQQQKRDIEIIIHKNTPASRCCTSENAMYMPEGFLVRNEVNTRYRGKLGMSKG